MEDSGSSVTTISGFSASIDSASLVPEEGASTKQESNQHHGYTYGSIPNQSMPRAPSSSQDSFDEQFIADNIYVPPETASEETPRAYVAPKAVVNHQDSFNSECSADDHGDARSSRSGSNHRRAGSDGCLALGNSDLPPVKVSASLSTAGSPVYSRISDSPNADGCPMSVPTTEKEGEDFEKVFIDTAAPFESVKQAVSKFGGITDWKAHKMQTYERRRFVEEELEKMQQKVLPEYKKLSLDAEEEKLRILNELESTKRLVEELKFNLERAQTEELHARQDSELAKLRVREMEQGIAEEESVATTTQLQVAKARHMAAISELESAKEELQSLREKYGALAEEKDIAKNKAKEAGQALKEVEKTLEDLNTELIATKEALKSANLAHIEAEERKTKEAAARDEEAMQWKKELKEAEEEIQRLNEELQSAKELESRLSTASALLNDLKAEMKAYTDMKPRTGNCEDLSVPEGGRSLMGSLVEVANAKKELEEVKGNVERKKSEVNLLKDAADSLREEIEKEKSSVAELKQRQGMVAESQQSRSVRKLDEKEIREKIRRAAEEADDAKTLVQTVREELRSAQEEAEQAKAAYKTVEMKLLAAQKEIETSRASEKVALEAINAEKRSKLSSNETESPNIIVIPLEEYQEMARRAREAEEQANKRLKEATAKVEQAKDDEMKTLESLEFAKSEILTRKDELKAAMERAEKAREGKLGAEQELRNWKARHEEQRRKGANNIEGTETTKSSKEVTPTKTSTEVKSQPTGETSSVAARDSNAAKAQTSTVLHEKDGDVVANQKFSSRTKRKLKKIMFPRIFFFFSWRKPRK